MTRSPRGGWWSSRPTDEGRPHHLCESRQQDESCGEGPPPSRCRNQQPCRRTVADAIDGSLGTEAASAVGERNGAGQLPDVVVVVAGTANGACRRNERVVDIQ